MQRLTTWLAVAALVLGLYAAVDRAERRALALQNTLLAGNALIDDWDGMIIPFAGVTSCPSNWSEYTDGRGRFIMGLPSGQTAGTTGGTAYANTNIRYGGSTHSHNLNLNTTYSRPTATYTRPTVSHTNPTVSATHQHSHTYTEPQQEGTNIALGGSLSGPPYLHQRASGITDGASTDVVNVSVSGGGASLSGGGVTLTGGSVSVTGSTTVRSNEEAPAPFVSLLLCQYTP